MIIIVVYIKARYNDNEYIQFLFYFFLKISIRKKMHSLHTPIESAEKPQIIAHLNEEHQDELIGFAKMYLNNNKTNNKRNQESISVDMIIEQVDIVEIYQQGVELTVQRQGADNTTIFIGFPTPINNMEELQYQYIALMQQLDKQQGKDTIKLTKQTFQIVETVKVTANMLRLVLSAPVDTPTDKAGYAYLFNLQKNDLPISETVQRQHCYYTLRKAVRSDDKTTAWVDVYLHGDTPAGNWASSLQAGDSITSKRELPEKIEHLTTGQTLLIADETSLPTVARLLELWQNPMAPIIINITNQHVDQDYLQKIEVSDTFISQMTVLPLIIEHTQDNLADKIDKLLSGFLLTNPIEIDKVWGAMEATTVKKLRRLLQKRLGLSRSDCVLKVYWRKD